MEPREFICDDCKSWVFSYSPDQTLDDLCHNCRLIRGLELSPEQEAEMRKVLNCERMEAPSE